MRARAHVRHGRLRRLLHHVAELAGQRQLALAVDDRHFRAENGAADFGPCQARDEPDFALLVGERVTELDHAQEIPDVFARDGDLVFRAFLDYFAGDLTTDAADFPLKVTDTRFPRVGADDIHDCVVGALDVLV